jgi:hypothetical protein
MLNFATICFTVNLSFSLVSFGYFTIKVWLSFSVGAHLSSTKTAYVVLDGSLKLLGNATFLGVSEVRILQVCLCL